MAGWRVRREVATAAVAALRRVLEAFPAEQDSSLDASVRRRLEGALIALDLAVGETASPPGH